jgi:hypothetical protein
VGILRNGCCCAWPCRPSAQIARLETVICYARVKPLKFRTRWTRWYVTRQPPSRDTLTRAWFTGHRTRYNGTFFACCVTIV